MSLEFTSSGNYHLQVKSGSRIVGDVSGDYSLATIGRPKGGWSDKSGNGSIGPALILHLTPTETKVSMDAASRERLAEQSYITDQKIDLRLFFFDQANASPIQIWAADIANELDIPRTFSPL